MKQSLINKKMLAWYKTNKRELPWRQSNNPYHIWISEIMLQQTRVETVKPYFYAFIETLPTIKDLAQCNQDVLLKLWQGLGYYNRAKNLQEAAKQCVLQYDGLLPNTYERLLELKGIGDYTAGAIASIAFDQKVTSIDGNVLRVYARLYNIDQDILSSKTKKQIQDLVKQDVLIQPGDFNQSLMDLGSSICIPTKTPKCTICPLASLCKANELGTAANLPVKKKAPKKRKEKYTVVFYRCQNQLLIHKRTTGLLSGLYEFSTIEGHATKKDFSNSTYLGKYKHIFSHVEWDLKGFYVELDQPFEKDDYFWATIHQIEQYYSIPTAFQHFYQEVIKKVQDDVS